MSKLLNIFKSIKETKIYIFVLTLFLFSVAVILSTFQIEASENKPQTEPKDNQVTSIQKLFTVKNKDGSVSSYPIPNEVNVKPGQCLVLYAKCNDPSKLESWEINQTCYPYDDVFKVDSVGNESYLVSYWAGTPDDFFLLKQKQLFRFDIDRSYKETDFTKIWSIQDCNVLANEYNQRKTQEKLAQEVKERQYKAHFKAGECAAELAQCPPVEEEWQKNEKCHPYNDVVKIFKVGKKNYQLQAWYGYTSQFYDLLGFSETKPFNYLDKNYIKVDCNKMKKLYPKGNYSPLRQRLKK